MQNQKKMQIKMATYRNHVGLSASLQDYLF